jgi:hypothetical protein
MPVVGTFDVVVGTVSLDGAVDEASVLVSVPLIVSGVAVVVDVSSEHADTRANSETKA